MISCDVTMTVVLYSLGACKGIFLVACNFYYIFCVSDCF